MKGKKDEKFFACLMLSKDVFFIHAAAAAAGAVKSLKKNILDKWNLSSDGYFFKWIYFLKILGNI